MKREGVVPHWVRTEGRIVFYFFHNEAANISPVENSIITMISYIIKRYKNNTFFTSSQTSPFGDMPTILKIKKTR